MENSNKIELESVTGHKDDDEQSGKPISNLNVDEIILENNLNNENESKVFLTQKTKPHESLPVQLPNFQSSPCNYDPGIFVNLPNQVIETIPSHNAYQMKNITRENTSNSTLSNPLVQSENSEFHRFSPTILKTSIEKNTDQTVDPNRSSKLYGDKIIKLKPSEHWNSYSVTFLKISLLMLQILVYFIVNALDEGLIFDVLRRVIFFSERFSSHILPIIWVSTHHSIRYYVINKIYKFKVIVFNIF